MSEDSPSIKNNSTDHRFTIPEDKLDRLKEAIKELGYNIEETEDGEIKILG